jgi:hypothetical protein
MEKNMVEVPENYSMNPEQMAQMQPNPLSQFMRQASIYIKLPSGGLYYPPGTIQLPENKEIPVLPMSTRDEITVNTPDALMNGQGVVDMIHSCCPSIKNAWAVPIVDLDTILIGIRIASYGENMEYTSTCPKCENADNYEIDLRQFMDMPVNMSFAEIFRTMTGYTLANITGSIEKIVTPDGVVVNNESHITDFVRNTERQFYESLRKYMEQITTAIPEKTVSTTCAECKEQYSTPFTFDQSNFFAFAS